MKHFMKILSFLLAAALLLSGCSSDSGNTTAAAGQLATDPDGSAVSGGSAETETTRALLFTQSGDLAAPVAKTANFSFSRGECAYLMATFSSNLVYYGVDTTKSLKEQQYPYEEGRTWFDVMVEECQGYMKEQLLLCEAAKAKGYSLTQEDLDEIAKMKDSAVQNAADMGWDVDTYFRQMYGTNIGWEHVEGIISKSRLSQKVTQEFLDREFADAELEEEFNSHLTQYGLIDYYSINLSDGEGLSDALLASTREAMEKAESLEAFETALSPFLQAGKEASEIQEAGGLEAYTKQYLENSFRKGIMHSDSEFFNWAFGEEAQEGQVYLLNNELTNTTYAYYLVNKPYKDEAPLVDVRHILFLVDEGAYADAQAARTKAEEIYNQWVAEGASEERFIELCAEYSGDGNASSGGLYTNVVQGQMVQSFNDWCFDESRKPGDHGMVDTDFGTHLIYFVEGHVTWAIQVKNSLLDQAYGALIQAQEALTSVETIKENIDSIER